MRALRASALAGGVALVVAGVMILIALALFYTTPTYLNHLIGR